MIYHLREGVTGTDVLHVKKNVCTNFIIIIGLPGLRFLHVIFLKCLALVLYYSSVSALLSVVHDGEWGVTCYY